MAASEEQNEKTQQTGITLAQLLSSVKQGARGNLTLATRTARVTEQLREDAQLPAGLRSLAQVLRAILAGDRQPDLGNLPEEFTGLIQDMLRDLLEAEKDWSPEEAEQGGEEEGLSLEELLNLVETAINGDKALAVQLLSVMQQMTQDQQVGPEIRALAQVLALILAGDRAPDMSKLVPEIAAPIKQMLDQLS